VIASHRVLLKQSGSRTPRVELVEIGPRALLTVRRHRLAGDDVARDAHRVPKTVKVRLV
jgi:ribosome production factor 2